MPDSTSDINAAILAIEEQENAKRRMLRTLLDERLRQGSSIVGLSSMMGTSRSFVTSVSLSWAAENIRFASELPMFKQHRDEDGRIVPNKYTQHLIQQREPDWTRQLPMTLYLAARTNHKFPPVLVVATRPWVDDVRSDQWSKDGIALYDSLLYEPIDSNGYFANLSVESGTILYAIDGQHRLMAIKGLRELIDTGRLTIRQKTGAAKATRAVTVDDIVAISNGVMDLADIQALPDEKIGLEVIPAVMRNERHDEALRRLRNIFVHVNRTAKPLSKGQLALLDEDNGFAVVARMTMVNHSLLEKEGRVEISSVQIPKSSSALTTLRTLQDMSTGFLRRRYPKWLPHKLTKMATRPEEEELEEGHLEFTQLFDGLVTLPSFEAVCQGASVTQYRKTGVDKGRAHLLFRPIAQVALAGAIGDLVGDGAGSSRAYWEKLVEADRRHEFQIDVPRFPWYGVAWDPVKRKMRRGSAPGKLIHRLLLHLLDGGTKDDASREQLRADFAEARVASAKQGIAVDLAGREVLLSAVKLPQPW